jgi:predicted dehydrogenase
VDTVRWGIIGCGDVAEHKSGPPLYQTPKSELIAVMRRDENAARDFAKRHTVPRWYSDGDALLEDPEINAVYIATPHHLHLPYAIKAAHAQKIVFCEKPMGTSLSEAQSIVEVCHAQGVQLCAAYYRRFWPVAIKLKELLAENAIGSLIQARIQLCDYFNGDPERTWITTLTQAGGGALANAGSHWIDLSRFLFGEIVSLTAVCSYYVGFEVEDGACMIMITQKNCSIILSSTWQGKVSINEVDMIGTEGRIFVPDLSAGIIQLVRGRSRVDTIKAQRSGPAHKELVKELVNNLISGAPVPVAGEEAVAVWKILEAAYLSNRSNCWVSPE